MALFGRKDKGAGGAKPRMFVTGRPRDHHYRFGHRELPALVRKVADKMPALAESGQMDEGLRLAWDAVGQQLPPADRWASHGLGATLHPTTHAQVVLVSMPQALHATEAHFAAITVSEGAAPRYIVLEHSWSVDDQPTTVVGEWTEEGHLNLGPGPEPDAAAFLARVESLLSLPPATT